MARIGDSEAIPENVMGSGSLLVVIGGPIARSEVAKLCERVRALVREVDAHVIFCDVGAIPRPDATTVDALARLQLMGLRCGREVRVLNASDELIGLLELTGLDEVVNLSGTLRRGGEGARRAGTVFRYR